MPQPNYKSNRQRITTQIGPPQPATCECRLPLKKFSIARPFTEAGTIGAFALAVRDAEVVPVRKGWPLLITVLGTKVSEHLARNSEAFNNQTYAGLIRRIHDGIGVTALHNMELHGVEDTRLVIARSRGVNPTTSIGVDVPTAAVTKLDRERLFAQIVATRTASDLAPSVAQPPVSPEYFRIGLLKTMQLVPESDMPRFTEEVTAIFEAQQVAHGLTINLGPLGHQCIT